MNGEAKKIKNQLISKSPFLSLVRSSPAGPEKRNRWWPELGSGTGRMRAQADPWPRAADAPLPASPLPRQAQGLEALRHAPCAQGGHGGGLLPPPLLRLLHQLSEPVSPPAKWEQSDRPATQLGTERGKALGQGSHRVLTAKGSPAGHTVTWPACRAHSRGFTSRTSPNSPSSQEAGSGTPIRVRTTFTGAGGANTRQHLPACPLPAPRTVHPGTPSPITPAPDAGGALGRAGQTASSLCGGVPLHARTVPSLARGGTARPPPPLLALVQPGSGALPTAEKVMTLHRLRIYEPPQSPPSSCLIPFSFSPSFPFPLFVPVVCLCLSPCLSLYLSVSCLSSLTTPTQTPAPPLAAPFRFMHPLPSHPSLRHLPSPLPHPHPVFHLIPTAVSRGYFCQPLSLFLRDFLQHPHFPSPLLPHSPQVPVPKASPIRHPHDLWESLSATRCPPPCPGWRGLCAVFVANSGAKGYDEGQEKRAAQVETLGRVSQRQSLTNTQHCTIFNPQS